MSRRNLKPIALLLAGGIAGTAVALVLLGLWNAPEARAGGVCRGNMGDFISSDDSGTRLYVWSLGTNPPQVYAYDFDTGTYTHKDLSLPRLRKPPPPEEKKPDKEINVSGTIWTPDPEERVAIINGKTYREGEVFTTKSGKKYKIIEIKPTNEVEYKEIKD
jgi:hypothetical protein